MAFDPLSAIDYCWKLIALFWLAGMLFTKRTERSGPLGNRVAQNLLALLGGLCIGGFIFPGTWMDAYFVPHTRAMELAGLAATAIGCIFAGWARLTLGANWSGRAMVKSGHELIVNGPYALARHPIYTGLLFALAGTVLAVGRWRGIVGFVIIVASLAVKMRQEERLMEQTFPHAYPAYRTRVKALIPGVL
ncbi:MAG: isoprenylcysteine carboxylmethyltransferase family protein [Terracidiphilus sp.]|nr:isoprenylcysteine carboxylmethyltransferase family protein [Terracidiphilus sp.]